MTAREILDRPIAFHRCLVELTGGIVPALMLSQAIYWSRRTYDDSGWFWKTGKEWFEEIGIGRHELNHARKRLIGLGLIEHKVKGLPAKGFYRVRDEALDAAFRGKFNELSAEEIIALYDTELASLSAAGHMRGLKAGVKSERVDYAEVLRKKGAICEPCGEPITRGPGAHGLFLAFDHKKAIAARGGHTFENVRPVHARCNQEKSGSDKEDRASLLRSSKLDGLGQTDQPASPKQSLNTEITAETTSIRDKKKKKAKQATLFSIASESLPPPLNTPEMQDAWDRWQEHCRQHGNKLTELAARAQIKRMREWALATGVERAIAAIDYSIEQNWKSIYEKKAGREDSAARPKEDYAKLNKQTAL